MSTYMICDGHSNAITHGVSANEVQAMAQRIANERGEPVYYSTAGDKETEVLPVAAATPE